MTKKILAVLLALAMIFSLCSVEMFAEVGASDVEDMVLAFEWTKGKASHDWWTVSSVFTADELSAFCAAMNTDGAIWEVAGNNPGPGGTMTNFNFDWGGHGIQMGNYPVGDFDLFASSDELKAAGKYAIGGVTDAIVQFNIYQETEVDVTVSKIAVYVPPTAKEKTVSVTVTEDDNIWWVEVPFKTVFHGLLNENVNYYEVSADASLGYGSNTVSGEWTQVEPLDPPGTRTIKIDPSKIRTNDKDGKIILKPGAAGTYTITVKVVEKPAYTPQYLETVLYTLSTFTDNTLTSWNGGWGGTAVVNADAPDMTDLRPELGKYAADENAYVKVTVEDGGKVAGIGLYLVDHWSVHLQFSTPEKVEGNSYYFKMTDFIDAISAEAEDLNFSNDWGNGRIQEFLVAGEGKLSELAIVTVEEMAGGMSLPEDYASTPAFDNATIETTDEGVVITPDGDIVSKDMLIALKTLAPDDGTVTVYYGEESVPYYTIKDTQESIIDPNELAKYSDVEGADEILIKCNWNGPVGAKIVINSLVFIDPDGKETPLEVNMTNPLSSNGGIVASAKLPELAPVGYPIKLRIDATVTDPGVGLRFYGNNNANGDHNLSPVSYFTTGTEKIVPDTEFVTYTTEFKKGATFIYPIAGDPKKPISKIVVKTKTGTPKVSKVFIYQAPKDDMTVSGYAIKIGSSQYHGYRVGPYMIPMPHNYYNGICLSCGQKAPEKKSAALVEADED